VAHVEPVDNQLGDLPRRPALRFGQAQRHIRLEVAELWLGGGTELGVDPGHRLDPGVEFGGQRGHGGHCGTPEEVVADTKLAAGWSAWWTPRPARRTMPRPARPRPPPPAPHHRDGVASQSRRWSRNSAILPMASVSTSVSGR